MIGNQRKNIKPDARGQIKNPPTATTKNSANPTYFDHDKDDYDNARDGQWLIVTSTRLS
jgi:hypothetical protein|tara:strand:- start:894 stop:1070 length:177 start_codon:yes stop_codon:yes gene_type:complete